jgi:hypothetical protein
VLKAHQIVVHKLTHSEVNYEHPAQGMNECRDCKHYDAPHCRLVKDPIRPEDWCKKFERRNKND